MELFVLLLIVAAGIFLYKKKTNKSTVTKTPVDYKIGTNYSFGLGFPQMDALAAEVFTASAKKGDVDSYAALGNMYARGVHFKKDYEEAYKWLKLAADSDHPTAMFELAKFYIEGYGIPKDEEKAMKLLIRSSELGEPSAQYLLGLIYEIGGFGLEINETEALNLFMKSAKLNNAEAQFKVGNAYFDGILISKDTSKGFEYWIRSAENNNIEAIKRLAIFYVEGIDEIEPSLEQALYWTTRAAELEDTEFQRILGSGYLVGTFGVVDYQKAALWSFKAAEKGDKEAQFSLGIMYKKGFFESGVDLDEAREWFALSAEQGFQLALEELELMENDQSNS
jgi:TPR repeat protein